MTGSGVGFSFQNIFYIKCYTFSHYIVSLTLNVLVHFGVAGVGLFKLLLLLTGSEAMKLTLLLYMVLSAYLSRLGCTISGNGVHFQKIHPRAF